MKVETSWKGMMNDDFLLQTYCADFETIPFNEETRKFYKEKIECPKCGKLFYQKHKLRIYCDECKRVKKDNLMKNNKVNWNKFNKTTRYKPNKGIKFSSYKSKKLRTYKKKKK
jgi:ribosomal protein S27AE